MAATSFMIDDYKDSKDYQLRSNTETSREEIAINTMISRAERNRYIEQQKLIQKQREDEKRKW